MNILNKLSRLLFISFLSVFLMSHGHSLYIEFKFNEKTIFGDTLQNSKFTDLLKENLNPEILELLKAGNLNTNSDENYNHLTNLIDKASTFISSKEVKLNLPTLKENFLMWKTSDSETKNILDYTKTLESIKSLKLGGKLPKQSPFPSALTLIDSSWMITAVRLVKAFNS